MRSKVVCVLVLIVAQLVASRAHAAGSLFRSYLSVNGDDSNPCTVSSPCRLLPAALNATESGGEVWILDSANYNTGAVTISQSVTVLAVPGALGSLLADGGDAVDITGTGIVVTFRTLVFREFDSNLDHFGINSTGSDAQLIVEGDEFSAFSGAVVVTGSGNANVTITNSTFRNNGSAFGDFPEHGNLGHALIDHCNFINNIGLGVYAAYAHVVVSNSTFAGTGQNQSSSAGSAVSADTDAVIALQNNVIEYNLIGALLSNDSNDSLGIVESNGNNTFLFNSNDVSGGSLTSISTK